MSAINYLLFLLTLRQNLYDELCFTEFMFSSTEVKLSGSLAGFPVKHRVNIVHVPETTGLTRVTTSIWNRLKSTYSPNIFFNTLL